jgi:hypothetical protein
VALGASVGACLGLVAGMAATARPQHAPPAAPRTSAPGATEPVGATPPSNPFAGKAAITQTGAS